MCTRKASDAQTSPRLTLDLFPSEQSRTTSPTAHVRLTAAATQAEASVHHRRQHDLVECNCACK